jgi:hypothetical protein
LEIRQCVPGIEELNEKIGIARLVDRGESGDISLFGRPHLAARNP